MSYIEKSNGEGEYIVMRVPLHWSAYIVPILITIIFAPLALMTFGLTLLIVLFAWIDPLTTERAITNRRVVYKKGFFNTKSEEMQLRAIETVEFSQSIIGRMLGYGKIRATGRGVSDISLSKAPNPFEVKKAIEQSQEDRVQA